MSDLLPDFCKTDTFSLQVLLKSSKEKLGMYIFKTLYRKEHAENDWRIFGSFSCMYSYNVSNNNVWVDSFCNIYVDITKRFGSYHRYTYVIVTSYIRCTPKPRSNIENS